MEFYEFSSEFQLKVTLNPKRSNIETTSVFLGPMWRVGNSLLLRKTSLAVVKARTERTWLKLPALTNCVIKLLAKFLCILKLKHFHDYQLTKPN